MSVKIFYKKGDTKEYCDKASIFDQLSGASHICITVSEDSGKCADLFLEKLSNLTSFEILPPINLNVKKDDMLVGAQIARKAKKINKKIMIYWLTKEMIKFQQKIDSELSEIAKTIAQRIL